MFRSDFNCASSSRVLVSSLDISFKLACLISGRSSIASSFFCNSHQVIISIKSFFSKVSGFAYFKTAYVADILVGFLTEELGLLLVALLFLGIFNIGFLKAVPQPV